MSAVETTTDATDTTDTTAAAPAQDWRRRRVSTRFLRSELALIFGRRRNWVGLAVLAALPIIMGVSAKVDAPTEPGPGGPDFFSSITDNGLFVALAALAVEISLFLPIAVSAISADSLAGEANSGTLRYLLAVPVHRTRLLAVKYAAVVIFAGAATLLVAATGTVVGLALFGGGRSPCSPVRRSASARVCCDSWPSAPTSRPAWPRSGRSGCSSPASPSNRSAPASPP